MDIIFDSDKNTRNIEERGLSFHRAADIEWSSALIHADTRVDYGEERLIALGILDGRLHVLVYTEPERERDTIRVISFRKANPRERRVYEQAKALN